MKDLQQQLDSLVDGELSREEYTRLLQSLDHEPSGWKQCALAFLESQALRRDMTSIAQVAAPVKHVERANNSKLKRQAVTQWLALAASLLLVFMLGRGSTSSGAPGRPALPDLAVNPLQQRPETSPTRPPQPGSMVLTVQDSTGAPRNVEIPVYDGNEVDPKAVLSQTPSVSPELLAELRKMGHNVRVEQRYVPVPLQDGRQAVVPVERIYFSPKTRPTF